MVMKHIGKCVIIPGLPYVADYLWTVITANCLFSLHKVPEHFFINF